MALCGFVVDVNTLKRVMLAVVKSRNEIEERSSLKNGLPGDGMIRHFRARHRDITFRNYGHKELAKFNGEDLEHVRSYERVFRFVEKQNPGLFSEASQFWNLDETSVRSEVGTKCKVFGPAGTSHGGLECHKHLLGAGGT